jgi:branched-chain amino acid transport system permease protein
MTASSFSIAPTAGQSRLKRAAPWLVAMAILSIMPFVFANASSVTIMSQMAITIVFALSYNMLLGQTGLLSFGHAVFMGMGGFFSLHLLNWIADGSFYLPLPLLPLAGGCSVSFVPRCWDL